MRQRPLACLALFVFLLLSLLPAGLFYRPRQIAQKCEGEVTGRVGRRTYREEKTQLELTGCQIRCKEAVFRSKRLLVYLTGAADYPVGTVLTLSGTIYPTEEPTNPGQFDSRLYYAGKGIDYTVFAERADVVEMHAAPVREGLLKFRERLGEVYGHVFDERESGVLRAMILGEKAGLDEEVKGFYQRNGISHLLAISGLHISLVALGLYRLFTRLGGHRLAAGISTVVLAAAYGWMTGASISAVRAAAMCALMIAAELLGRTYDMPSAIGAVALTMMLTNPLCVKQSAFLLSFGAVLGIGLFMPLWKLYCPWKGKLFEALGAGLSVLFVTFPLLLLFFCEYPLYSTFLNLLVIPLMSLLMTAGILCGLVGLVWLPAASLAGIPCRAVLWLYEWLGRRCLILPGAVLPIGRPAAWKLMLYYAVLVLALLVLYREKRRGKYGRGEEGWKPRKKPAAVCALSFLAAVCLLCLRVRTGLSVTMLDVGQGEGIFFRDPAGNTYLCDGGSSSVPKVGSYRILPFLKTEGVSKLDYLLVSHMDKDHISGITELLEKSPAEGGVGIGHAVLPALAVKDETYLSMEELLAKAHVPVLYMGAGDRLSGKGFSLSCLWPEKGAASEDRNDSSLVLLARYGEFGMLLTGDIGEKAEERIAASGMLKPVEILKAAHHGSRYSSGTAFLGKARPALCLISCSAANRYGHPGAETLERLKAAGSRVWITKDCGAVRVWTDGRKVRVRGYAAKK